MDSKYDQLVEHQLFHQQQQQQEQKQQQFVQFSFYPNKLLKRKYQCNAAAATTKTATIATIAGITKLRRSHSRRQRFPKLSVKLFDFNKFYLTTTTPISTTKTITTTTITTTKTIITTTTTISPAFPATQNVNETKAHLETNATDISHVDGKFYNSNLFKTSINNNNNNNNNNTNNNNNNYSKKRKKSHKYFYRKWKYFYTRIFYYLLMYISLLFWLNVKSSVIVIAGSTINSKGQYDAINDTLNNTLLQLKNLIVYSNHNNSHYNSSSNISHRQSESQNENQSQSRSQIKEASINDRTVTTAALTTTSSTIISTSSNIVWLNGIPSSISETDSGPISIPIYTINTYTTLTAHILNETTLNDNIDSIWELPSVQTICVTIILLFVILGTIVGNILVCIAVCMVRKLRRPCNYLLVSLALSDLCVAVLVMPIALLNEVFEKWNFGPVLCDIWVSFDVLCCTASILNLCAISVDRYLAITKPLEYGVKRTPRRMMICVALVWLAAACISLPPLLILGNEHVDERGRATCTVCQNFAYQIYATLGSFYIPLAVMLFVYYQIFRAARRIVLEEKRAQTHLQHALNGTGSSPPIHTELDYATDGRYSGGDGDGGSGGRSGGQQQQKQQQQHRHSSYDNTSLNYGGVIAIAGQRGGGSGSSGLLGSPHHKKLRFQLAKEKKASTTLGIIMSAFTICWLPFFILALIRPFIESESVHVPPTLSSVFLWLGYANSLLNPIIYATLNRDFRKPFQEILYFRCSSLNTMMRENYYQDQYGEPPSQRVMLGDERHGARESFL